jgi:general secretion pathway protein G
MSYMRLRRYRLLLILAIVVLLVTVYWIRVRAVKANRIRMAKTRISEFDIALDAFEIGAGRYPASAEGLQALIEWHTDREPWVHFPDDVFKDPWGTDYLYAYPGQHGKKGYDLYSAGPDGIPGTSDDITNW